ncbi:R3H and coiled-coil domain-containing protein 1-like [Frankliniella occidentalis]|uniref:R3H and coiled-coil domain-containing protein 1-like n=1 Tax=Frankliniella occidentalis TaxID=133901 RepID=A0A9C6XA78_FRAOC|nr:R3H and coiled-coil domain-containing protein 1-like [Frankliniella occidentalis]
MAFSYPESDADFVDKVKTDLGLFVKSSPFDSVLVFPPVNSFYRFLIHQLAQDNFDQLRTFSIGEDPDRRIVVCTKDLVAR